MTSRTHPLSRATSVVATPDQVSADLDGEVVILHLGGGEYFGLDQVAARVWELIASPQSLTGLRNAWPHSRLLVVDMRRNVAKGTLDMMTMGRPGTRSRRRRASASSRSGKP